MEQEVGQAPAVPVLKDAAAISGFFASAVWFYLMILLPAITSLHGNGSCGEGRIIWAECSKVRLGLSCEGQQKITFSSVIPSSGQNLKKFLFFFFSSGSHRTVGQENATTP